MRLRRESAGYSPLKKREVDCKCFWDRYLGRACQLLANFFPLYLVTIPDVFAKVNSVKFFLASKEASGKQEEINSRDGHTITITYPCRWS